MILSSSFTVAVSTTFMIFEVSAGPNNYHQPIPHHLIRERLVSSPSSSSAAVALNNLRSLQTSTPTNCSNLPWLWEIIDDSTGNVTGYGVGTAYFSADVATSEEGFGAIMAAADASCSVYTEFDYNDPQTVAVLDECYNEVFQDPKRPTIYDIPDPELQQKYVRAVDEIQETIGVSLHDWPLDHVMESIIEYNTKEERDAMKQFFKTGVEIPTLDNAISALGRPSNALGSPQALCDYIDMYPPRTKDDLITNFTSKGYDVELNYSLTASYSPDLAAYRCGPPDELTEVLAPSGINQSKEEEENFYDLIFEDRIISHANKMVIAMKSNSDSPTLFAFSVGYIENGVDNNLLDLLKERGYTTKRIEDVDAFKSSVLSLSDEQCNATRRSFDNTSGSVNTSGSRAIATLQLSFYTILVGGILMKLLY